MQSKDSVCFTLLAISPTTCSPKQCFHGRKSELQAKFIRKSPRPRGVGRGMNETTEQRDLRDYFRPVLRRWWLILAVVPVVTVGTYLYYDAKPKVYSASTQLYVQPSALNQLLLGGGAPSSPVTVLNLAH